MNGRRMVEIFEAASKRSSGGAFFHFSPPGVAAAVVFSVIGFVYIKTGRRDADVSALGAGAALILCPYFVQDTLYMILTGLGIVVLRRLAQKYW